MDYNILCMDEENTNATINLSRLLDNLPGMAYQAKADALRTMHFVSEGCQQLTGYPPSAFIQNKQMAFGMLVHERDRQMLYDEIGDAIAEKRPFRVIYRLMSAESDEEQWVLEKGTPVFNEDGTVEVIEGFITDHTSRMQAFQQLEQRVTDRTRKLSALYDILEVAADLGDLETTINRTLSRVLKAIKGNVGAIHLLDGTEPILKLAAEQGMATAVVPKIRTLPLAESELGSWIMHHKRPLIIPSMTHDPRTVDFASDDILDVYIGVPIVSHENVLGMLTVLSDDMSGYSAKEELELLISVGEQIGVVVENARLRQQTEQLVVLEERNRLARDLHDSVTQSLYSVTLFAEAGRTLAEAGDYDKATRYFTEVLDTGQQALKEMRLLLYKLRPHALEDGGLVASLRHRLNAVEARSGVVSDFQLCGPIELPLAVEDALFHIAQEALNNSLKHAGATSLGVALCQEETAVTMTITDNGCGFEWDTAVASGGLGLSSMQERCQRLDGRLVAETAVGEGTIIKVIIPLDTAQESE